MVTGDTARNIGTMFSFGAAKGSHLGIAIAMRLFVVMGRPANVLRITGVTGDFRSQVVMDVSPLLCCHAMSHEESGS